MASEMKFRGRDRTVGELLYKGATFMPRRLYWHYHDEKVQRNFARVLRGGADVREENALRENLVRTLRRAHRRVPYWRQFSCLDNVTRENVFDCLSKLPLLDKDTIRREGARMHIEKDMSGYGMGVTGGTTGRPLDFYYGRAEEISHQKAFYEYITGVKYKGSLDKKGAIVSFDGTRPSEIDVKNNVFWTARKPSIYGSLDFCTIYMRSQNILSYIAKLVEVKPIVIRGYSNAIINIAKAIEEHGELNFAPLAIYVTSEYCSKESMEKISKIFNCPVYGQYGQTEACLFAWTKANDDIYYCSPYYGYVEVVDERGKFVKKGEIGEVVVTAFGNDVQPFIRYKTGDMVRFGGMENGVVKIDKLMGRVGDYLVNKNGEHIPIVGNVGIHYLSCRSKIIQYQIEQNYAGRVIFRIVKKDNWNKDDEAEIHQLLGKLDIIADIVYMDEISVTKRGKERLVIQRL